MKRYLPLLIIAGVLIVAVVAGATLINRRAATNTAATIPSDLATRPITVTNPPRAGAPGANPPRVDWQTNSEVTLEEFGDYQCPPCGSLFLELEKLKPLYGKRVRLVFRHLPLTNIHENAADAARAAEAAGNQSHFWEMHAQLYRQQSQWSKNPQARQLFAEYARTLGLDVTRFTRDMDSLAVNTRIRQDFERADSLGATGTPTVYLNGRELTLNAAGDLQRALDAALTGKTP